MRSVGPVRRRSSLEPVLGSRLSLLLDVDADDVAEVAEELVVREVDRLEAILSLHQPQSPFNRWRRRELRRPPTEVVAVLRMAAEWFERTSGAFNPCLGAAMRYWRRAELEQRAPEPAELRALAQLGQVLPFEVVADDVVAVGDCAMVDVQALAKGWVVDQLVAAALGVSGVRSVLVDIGGDVRHAGPAVALVALEDPFRVADNAPPVTVVRLADGALATSGGGRRGWRIDGRWYGHLLDPRTGWPLPDRRSCSVIAASAATADAAASAAAVMDVVDLASFADQEDLPVLRVSEDGSVWRSDAWLRVVVEESVDGDPHQHDGEERQRAGGEQGAAASLALEDLDADPRQGDHEQEDR